MHYLNEDGKEYHHNNSSDEQFLPGKHSRRKQKYKWKTNSSSEASIGDNELVLKSERNCPEQVNDLSQNKNTWREKTKPKQNKTNTSKENSGRKRKKREIKSYRNPSQYQYLV